MSRRAKRVGFSSDWLIACMQSMNHWPDIIQFPGWDSSIPADAKVESVMWCMDHRCWLAVLLHDSFPECPECADLPSDFYPSYPPPEPVLLVRDETGAFRDGRAAPVLLKTQIMLMDPTQSVRKLSTEALQKLSDEVSLELNSRTSRDIQEVK